MEEDGGEEEEEGGAGGTGALVVGDLGAGGGAAASYELVLPSASGTGTRVLGCREFARYYRQRHRLGADSGRPGVAAARVLAQYRRMAVPLLGEGPAEEVQQRRETRQRQRLQRERLRMAMRRNINDNLPKNVPY